MREKLIDAIIELAQDECQDVKEMIEIAKESDSQLIDRLISIAEYYRDNY